MNALLLAAVLAAAPGIALAESMYVATLRDRGPDASNIGGGLYVVDPAAKTSRLVAPLRVGGAIPIGLTGLSMHPRTGVLYGITGGFAPSLPKSLVTIDPETGNATLVGNLGTIASDIRFDDKGTLYVWMDSANRLGTIDVGTGRATPVEQFPEYPQTLGGGIAVDAEGRVFISANSSAGSLDIWDPATRHLSNGPTITGAPFVSSINSMAFSPAGKLYAVNSNLGTPAKARLIVIDAQTGHAEEVASLPDDVDPIAFPVTGFERPMLELPSGTRQWMRVTIALAFGLLVGFLVGRRR